MKRREFVEKLGIGSAGIAAAAALAGTRVNAAAAKQHDHGTETDGPLAQATVSFGQWKMPLDRFSVNPPPSANNHHLIPYVATIKAGGAVNFLFSGLHNLLIYGEATTMDDLVALLPPRGNTDPFPNIVSPNLPFGGFLDFPTDRVYRGLNPQAAGLGADRVEAVTFAEKGTYLAVCGVVAHTRDRMHGFVKVI